MTENWYDNKTIYEMLQQTKEDMANLQRELAETRTLIRDYNGLRQKVDDTAAKMSTLMWMTPIAIAVVGLLFTALNFLMK